MDSYFPIDRSFLDSSMWFDADSDTRLLWFFLLLSADYNSGVVNKTIPAIASQAKIPPEKVRIGLEYLATPDQNSRSSEYSGRRIEFVEPDNVNSGIKLLNYGKYREKCLSNSTQRVRRFRHRQNETLHETDETLHETQKRYRNEKEKEKEEELIKKRNKKKKSSDLRSVSESKDIRRVFDHWVAVFWSGNGCEPKLDTKRRARVKARLTDGFTVDDLCKAIDGCKANAWHIEKGYTGLQTILRDTESTEKHINHKPSVTSGPLPATKTEDWEPWEDDYNKLMAGSKSDG